MFYRNMHTNHGVLLVEYWSGSEVFPEPMYTATAPMQSDQLVNTFGMGRAVRDAVAKCCRSVAYYQKRNNETFPGR